MLIIRAPASRHRGIDFRCRRRTTSRSIASRSSRLERLNNGVERNSKESPGPRHDSQEDSDEKSNAWGLNKRPDFIPEDPEKSIADGPNCEKSLSGR